MKILFIGNSHTFVNEVPYLFQQFCKDQSIETEVAMLTKPGMGWDYHIKQPDTKFHLNHGNYDVVVLQHVAHPMGDLEVMQQVGEELINWVKSVSARPVLFMTWTKKTDGVQIQPYMAKQYELLAQKTGAELAPVGNNWWKYHQMYPEDELYYQDGEHASIIGSTLAAITIACTIFHLDPAKAVAKDERTQKILNAIQ